jgi:bifunctional non-homologous end joining protein LigD/DNA ligase-1
MSGLFDRRDTAPMLIGEAGDAFDSPDYLYELKLDGVRCLAYLSDQTEFVNKRKLLVSPLYPELTGICKQVRTPCILDGELIVMRDGKPDFSEMQRRALMGNQVKIEMASKILPVSFTAFDILHEGGRDLIGLPLTQRKEILNDAVKRENDRLAVSRYIENAGRQLYALTERQGLEGIVAKLKASRYYPGKRTREWMKCKNLQDDDYVVCGYIPKREGVTSLVIGQYHGADLLYRGHVTLGDSSRDFQRIRQLKKLGAPPFHQTPAGNENAVWIEPALVCTVKYMEKHKNGSLRQPVYKGLRNDKAPEECTV